MKLTKNSFSDVLKCNCKISKIIRENGENKHEYNCKN